MDISAIAEALATAVSGVSGINQAFGEMPGDINPPTFAVMDYDLDYHGSFGKTVGLKTLSFTCLLLTSRSDDITGLKALNTFLGSGSSSVLAAIEADQTLGGLCGTLVADGASGVGRHYEVAGVAYFGAQINVRVWTT